MRHFAGTVALVLPFLAALACGGRVGVVGGGGNGSCPSPAAVENGIACTAQGQTCSGTVDVCGGSSNEDCTCASGVWSCPAVAAPCVEQCPPTNGVQPGSSCDLTTQGACTVEITATVCDGTVAVGSCSCEASGQGGATWGCGLSLPECDDAGPSCPDPSVVVQGNACAVSSQLQCDSATPVFDCDGNAIEVSCDCLGGLWSCPQPPSCPPPTGCPDPQDVEQGVSCDNAQQQCPGNPTDCDGAVFYDAFECDGGQWNDVAPTACSGSSSSGGGGGGSSGSSSGGGFVDAGKGP
jgi:hypothetical protein